MSDAVGSIDSGSSGVELFDSPRQCWRVTGASLDVFAVPVNAAGEQVETGRYLFTMDPVNWVLEWPPVLLPASTGSLSGRDALQK